jgi:CheY-like chemotaxis protein
VLVVEDDSGMRAMTTAMLTELGYEVETASDGEAALALLGTGRTFTLMLTDIVMPGMNGRLLADRTEAQWPAMKVLFTTGYTRNAVVHNGMVDPGVAFLAKPFTLPALAAKVRAVLDS